MKPIKLYIEEIANQVVKQLLIERLSISEEVEQATLHLLDYINKLYKERQPNKQTTYNKMLYVNGDMKLSAKIVKQYNFVVDEYLQKLISAFKKVHCCITEVPNDEAYRQWYDELTTDGQSHENGLMELNAVAINGQLRNDLLKELIQHEMEHMLQFPHECNVYIKKRAAIAKQHLQLQHNPITNVAWLLYFFESREVNAKMQEFYNQLYHVFDGTSASLQKSYCYVEYNDVLQRYQELKQLSEIELQKVLDEYHLSVYQFWRYINGQIRYFQTKVKKVVANYLEKMEDNKAAQAQIEENLKHREPYVFSDKFNWLPFPIR